MKQSLTTEITLIGVVLAVSKPVIKVTYIFYVDALARDASEFIYLTCSIICNKNEEGRIVSTLCGIIFNINLKPSILKQNKFSNTSQIRIFITEIHVKIYTNLIRFFCS